MNNYNEVPNIISCKDLDYLSDMFSWNYGAYKSTTNSVNSVLDQEIKDILIKSSNVFYENMNNILRIIQNGGSYE